MGREGEPRNEARFGQPNPRGAAIVAGSSCQARPEPPEQ